MIDTYTGISVDELALPTSSDPTPQDIVDMSMSVYYDRQHNATWLIGLTMIDQFPLVVDAVPSTSPCRIKAGDLGWSDKKLKSVKARLKTFKEGWTADGMNDYNNI